MSRNGDRTDLTLPTVPARRCPACGAEAFEAAARLRCSRCLWTSPLLGQPAAATPAPATGRRGPLA